MSDIQQRFESDSMGKVALPENAYWGAQAERASQNFGVSPLRMPVPMLNALALIKKSAAVANHNLGLLEDTITNAIQSAADEVLDGKMNDQFPVDVFQTGSGTSWNMNINEVIANRANESLGHGKGTRSPVHPNDHVNKGQSSNDVIPTAISVGTRLEADKLVESLDCFAKILSVKAAEFADVVKLGRTHLQDAVPVTLGQEFSGYARQMEKGAARIRSCFTNLEELALGGTAVGTGLNTHPEFAAAAIAAIAVDSGRPFVPAGNRFEAIAARDSQMELMGAVNTVAVSLFKIAQDLRLLSSGPRAALGEIRLPSLQPGSSIMPGKINPVMPEMVIQVMAHIMGKHLSVTVACQNAPLELNIMQPLIAYETLSALDLMTHAVDAFGEKCVRGIEADRDRCRNLIDLSLAMVTPLALKIGYDRAAEIAHKAYEENITVKEAVVREGVLTEEEAIEVLNPEAMLGT
ncbi:MAG: class II fumarate hydratase [Spirochaetales bacterium]|jgi:fumarate hydratase, class II|nr:class II fumarate hydratase [Spirochaetales bacterium]